MRIVSYNINGIRAAIKKGFVNWLSRENYDVVCLQEIKANPEQFDVGLFEDLGYHCYWNPAQKKGYSGVAILSKIRPTNIVFGCNNESIDPEGRVLKIIISDFSIMSCYFPSGTSGDSRQEFKMMFLDYFYNYIAENKNNLLVSGDFNICHQAIDIHNPIVNKNSSGFLPEEREWMSNFIELGFIDTFRHCEPLPHNYTWWSYRANSRKRNKGWRIDYHMLSNNLEKKIDYAKILKSVSHSDHCPILLKLK